MIPAYKREVDALIFTIYVIKPAAITIKPIRVETIKINLAYNSIFAAKLKFRMHNQRPTSIQFHYYIYLYTTQANSDHIRG